MSGVYGYFGVTTSGKTTLALEHLRLDVALDGRPSAILDCMPARNLRGLPHAKDFLEVVQLLYVRGTHAVWTPRSDDELGRFFDVVHFAGAEQGKPIHVLWDEAALGQTPQRIDDRIRQALLGWQHNDCTFRLVSQRPGDLHGTFYSCIPEVYCFKVERDKCLDRVRDELSLQPEVIAALPQGKFETYSRNRFTKVQHESSPPAPEPPSAPAPPVDVQRSDVVQGQPGAP